MLTIRRWWAAFSAGPAYPPGPSDLQTVDLVGLRLPIRASIAVAIVTFALLFDYSGTFLTDGLTLVTLAAAAGG